MSSALSAHERFAMPEGLEAYRSIGPFDENSLPAGLLREHRLREGTWARLMVLSGTIEFVWDDHDVARSTTVLAAGETITVPPQVPHHIETSEGPFSIEIEFCGHSS